MPISIKHWGDVMKPGLEKIADKVMKTPWHAKTEKQATEQFWREFVDLVRKQDAYNNLGETIWKEFTAMHIERWVEDQGLMIVPDPDAKKREGETPGQTMTRVYRES